RIMRDCLHSSSRSFELVQTDTLEDAVQKLSEQSFDIIMLDLSLPDCFGPDALTKLKTAFPSRPVVVVTGNVDQDQAESFVELGADDYLFKNEITSSGLWKSIIYATSQKNLQNELHKQTQELMLA